jgi:hypothetical protein
MSSVGRIESLWRYPVKSMRGEELAKAFAGFAGVYGDRVYAFRSSAAIRGFPYHTAREKEAMLLYGAAFRHPERVAAPPNLAEAEALAPGVTPVYGEAEDFAVDVTTPAGEVLAADDPRLLAMLKEGGREGLELSLMRSERALTDCRPISLFSIQTVEQLCGEAGVAADKRRFRANVYVDLASGKGFGEDEFVGRRLRIGAKAVVIVTDRDPRCKMITLDPETAQQNPEVSKRLAKGHEGKAGVYGAVVVEGVIRKGDEIVLLD